MLSLKLFFLIEKEPVCLKRLHLDRFHGDIFLSSATYFSYFLDRLFWCLYGNLLHISLLPLLRSEFSKCFWTLWVQKDKNKMLSLSKIWFCIYCLFIYILNLIFFQPSAPCQTYDSPLLPKHLETPGLCGRCPITYLDFTWWSHTIFPRKFSIQGKDLIHLAIFSSYHKFKEP